MGRWIAYLLAFGLILYLPFSAAGEGPQKSQSLLVRSNAAQFDIVLGRITPLHIRPGYSRSHVNEDPTTGYTETLSTCLEGKTPAMHYERLGIHDRLAIDLARSQELTIQIEQFESPETQHTPSKLIAFHQNERGKVRLSLGDATNTTEYTAPSLWHLIMAEPAVCRQHLFPLLEPLRLSVEVEKTAEEVRHTLLRFKSNHDLPDISRVNSLIVQLGHKEFRQRQAAERELRELGHCVMPLLMTCDRLQMDVEQRQRICSVLAALRTPTPDTAERVAHWLIADKAVWLIFLGDELPSVRETAAQHLAQLAGKSFEFNLAGSSAERDIQIAKLRKTLVLD